MSKGNGMTVFGIILGLVGAGLGGYLFYNSIVNPPQTVTNYSEYEAGYTYLSTTFVTLPTAVSISVPANTSVYVSFNCWTFSNPVTMLGFYIQINGEDMPVSMWTGASDSRNSISLQYYNASLPAGTYDITIKSQANLATDTRLYSLTLYVQTIS